MDNWLLYATAGLALLGANTNVSTIGGVACTIAVLTAVCSGTDHRLCAAAGAGIEYGITPAISAKFEYMYIAAASLEVSHINEVRAGLNYRFGGNEPKFGTPLPHEIHLLKTEIGNTTRVKEISFDISLGHARVSIFVQCAGLPGFVPAGARGGTRCHAGARLLWAWLSPQPVWLLRSQWHAIRLSARVCTACSGCATRVSVRLPPWSIRPLLPLLK
jgi:hypothetical protein